MGHLRAICVGSLVAIAAGLMSLGGAAAEARPNPTARTVSSWLLQYHAAEAEPETARYAVAYVDLNADGIDEAVAYYESRGRCGTGGCTMYVLASRGGFWRRVSGHTVVNLPIRVLAMRRHGWSDLSVRVSDAFDAYDAALPFDGQTYPLNPWVPPARRLENGEPGRLLIGRNAPLLPLRR